MVENLRENGADTLAGAGDEDDIERDVLLHQLKAEDLESILKLKRTQKGLINPEFGGGLSKNPALDIPSYEEVSLLNFQNYYFGNKSLYRFIGLNLGLEKF